MQISEITQPLYYHGSLVYLPVGTILKPRDDYENDWIDTDFYIPLERWRPKNMLAHRESVFMTDNLDDVDLAGGGTEWLMTVKPTNPIQRHDLNWSSEISSLISQGYDQLHPKVKQAAENYWNGIPHTDESIWEYLTPQAKIIKIERY